MRCAWTIHSGGRQRTCRFKSSIARLLGPYSAGDPTPTYTTHIFPAYRQHPLSNIQLDPSLHMPLNTDNLGHLHTHTSSTPATEKTTPDTSTYALLQNNPGHLNTYNSYTSTHTRALLQPPPSTR